MTEDEIRDAIIKCIPEPEERPRLTAADYEQMVRDMELQADYKRSPSWDVAVIPYRYVGYRVVKRRVPRAWWGWMLKLWREVKRLAQVHDMEFRAKRPSWNRY